MRLGPGAGAKLDLRQPDHDERDERLDVGSGGPLARSDRVQMVDGRHEEVVEGDRARDQGDDPRPAPTDVGDEADQDQVDERRDQLGRFGGGKGERADHGEAGEEDEHRGECRADPVRRDDRPPDADAPARDGPGSCGHSERAKPKRVARAASHDAARR